MTEILPRALPLDPALGQQCARTPDPALPSFADWLSAVPAVGRGIAGPMTSDGAAIALPDSALITADDQAALRAPPTNDALTLPSADAPWPRSDIDPPPLQGISPDPGIASAPGLQPPAPDPQPVAQINPGSGAGGYAPALASHAPIDQTATLGREPIGAGTVALNVPREGEGAAKIFNEDGFFMPAQPVAHSDDAPAAPLRMSAPALEVVAAPAPARAHANVLQSVTAPVERGRGTAGGGPSSPHAAAPHVPIDSPASVTPPTETVDAAALPEPDAELEAPLAATTPRWSSAAAQARAALRIAIRDLERGLQIIVAANTLDHQERERLASEIAGLLSRHGLLPRDVRVTGAPHAQTGRNG
jgi:hypothetical protein